MLILYEYVSGKTKIAATSSRYDQKMLDKFVKLTPLKGTKILLPKFINGKIFEDADHVINVSMISTLDKEEANPKKITWIETKDGNLVGETSFGNVHISKEHSEARIYYPDSIMKNKSVSELKKMIEDKHSTFIKNLFNYWLL